MPVFDFNNTPEEKKEPVCTYTIFRSNAPEASADQPILVLDNSARQWKHHSCGVFENPNKRTAFEFKEEGGAVSADILRIDARFVSLVRWLGEHRLNVRLSGENRPDVEGIPAEIKSGLEILCVETMDDVIRNAFVSGEGVRNAYDNQDGESGNGMRGDQQAAG